MRPLILTTAALLLATPGLAGEVTEIDKPASMLEQVFAEEAELPGGANEVRVVRATLEPKTAGSWHVHPTPVYVFVTKGELTLEVDGEEAKTVKPGEAVAETLNARMRAVNNTDEPVEVVVFQISPAEKEFLEEDKQN